MACTYGVERFFLGQDSMVTHVPSMKFKDSFFPAASSSLYWEKFIKDQNDAESVFKKKVDNWSRPTNMYPKKAPSLWGEKGLQSHGLRQGLLSDCWLLGAAAAIAEHPERLKKVFS